MVRMGVKVIEKNDGGAEGRGLHFRQGSACAKPLSGGL